MIETAIGLAKEGFRVFPLVRDDPAIPVSRRKAPAFGGWKDIATADPIQVSAWWAGLYSGRNIGIATGHGLLVLDCDAKGKDGLRSLQDLDDEGMPWGKRVETPSGGRHVYLSVPLDCGITVSIGRLPGYPGIDVRCDGGFVAAPGSFLDGYGRYVDLGGEIEPAPQWLVDLCRSAKSVVAKAETSQPIIDLDRPANLERAKNYLLHEAPEAIEGDYGDETTYKVAARIREFGISKALCADLMLDHWNEHKAFPPWDPEDLAKKVENAYAYATGYHGGAAIEAEFDVVEILDNKRPITEILEPPKTGLPIRDLGSLNWSPKQNYLVRDLLNYGQIGLITGDSNAGKSPFALDLAAHIATGKPWHGRKVRKGYVLHLSTEGWSGLENRLEAARRTHFKDGDNPAIGYAALSLNLREPGQLTKQIIDAVNTNAARFGVPPALIVVDTLSHTLGGGSDKDDDVARAVIRTARRIVAGTGATILFTHHPTKQVGGSDYRGSSVWTNDTDVRIRIEVEPNGTRKVTTPRVKESRELEPVQFRVKVLELGKDSEGDPVTSVAVEWLTDFDMSDVPLSEDAQKMLDTFFDEVSLSGKNSLTTRDWNQAFLSVFKGPRGGRSEKTLSRLRTELVSSGHIRRASKNQWVSTDVDIEDTD